MLVDSLHILIEVCIVHMRHSKGYRNIVQASDFLRLSDTYTQEDRRVIFVRHPYPCRYSFTKH